MNPLWRDVALHVPSGRAQFKLAVSSPDDPGEREADRMADQVMRTSQGSASQGSVECGEDTGRSADGLGDGVEGRLASGVPLGHGARTFFESRFGHDFGDVRVHADSQADAAARSVNALAFTVGRDVAFRAGEYAPDTHAGRRLLAHELTHVLQQRGSPRTIQRAPACPARPAGETAQSRTPAGVLPANVIFAPAAASAISRLDVVDFAVGSANLPPGTTSDPEWQRARSIMGGDPEIKIQVAAFTDCAGTDAENVSLRKDRMDTVLSAMPAHVAKKVLFNMAIPTTTFADTNATPEGRARNRSVRITFTSAPPKGKDPCDMLTKAKNIDEYIFMVKCLESRLKLTTPADAPKALSALRQVYFGSGSWSAKPHPVWDTVIDKQPWSPGSDPTPQLGAALMGALKASDEVTGTDISHVLTGLDAMMNPHDVDHLPTPINATTVPNEEWATWAGDVGSAAAEWVVDTVFTSPATPLSQAAYFTRFAGDDDLHGDVDAFAMRAGFNAGGTPSSKLKQTLRLTGTLSEDLRQYYRITSSALGVSRGRATKDFIEAYGGVLSGTTVTNRAALAARMRPSVSQFANLFMLKNLLKRGFFASAPRPVGAPLPNGLIDPAVDVMTDLFITWLEQHP